MWWKNNKVGAPNHRESSPTIIAQDIHVLGNIISDGVVDFAGTIDGNMRCNILTLRPQAVANGEIAADTVHIYGKVKGLVRARHVHLYSSSHIEGIIMHESLSIEDGAYIDGKCKRSDKPLDQEISPTPPANEPFADTFSLPEEEAATSAVPAAEIRVMKKNIRLITQ